MISDDQMARLLGVEVVWIENTKQDIRKMMEQLQLSTGDQLMADIGDLFEVILYRLARLERAVYD